MRGRRADTPATLADRYVRENIMALVVIGENPHSKFLDVDHRTATALWNRRLIWQDSQGAWNLASAGSAAVRVWEAEQEATAAS
jgi:hypothetical protein